MACLGSPSAPPKSIHFWARCQWPSKSLRLCHGLFKGWNHYEPTMNRCFIGILRDFTGFFWGGVHDLFGCIFHDIWLVVWNMDFMFHFIYGMSSFPLTFIFFRGVGIPPTRWRMLISSFILWMVAKSCTWDGRKPINNGMFTTYELVIRISQPSTVGGLVPITFGDLTKSTPQR